MREIGQIIRVEEGGLGVVRLAPGGGCAQCGLGRTCGVSTPGFRELTVALTPGIQVGDVVEIEIPARGVVMAAVLVFFVPLCLGLFAYMVSFRLGGRGGIAIAAFFGAFALFAFLLSFLDRALSRRRSLTPRLVRKIEGRFHADASGE